MVFFLLIFNLGITIFIFLLTGMTIFSQILFIIFAMFLPISFLLSMIPSYENMAKQAVVRVFNTIMTRAGITLIVTVAFSISSMFYNISSDYPFFMIAFLQIVCFAGIYIKMGDLMSMFSLNAGDAQHMGRRIFRRPYLFMRHRARRMERRMAKAVDAGTMLGAGAGAVAGNRMADTGSRRQAKAPSRENRTASSMGQRAGSAVGAMLDAKNKFKDKANTVKENIKDMPTQTAYAVHSAKEKAKSSVSDFRRGIVQEQQSRQTGRMEKQEQHRQSIADKRMELQKAQEAKQSGRKADGSATAGATRTRVHDRPVTASAKDKSQTTSEKRERPATSGTVRTEQTKTPAVKERPLSSGTNVRNPENTTQRQTIRHTEIQTSQKERVNTRQTVHQARFTEKSKQKQQTVKQIQKIKKGRIK